MSIRYRSPHRKEYHHSRKFQLIVIAVLIVALAVLAIYSLSINNFKLTFEEAWTAVFNRIRGIEPETYIESMIDYVAIDVNAPRAIGAILVGTMLAVSGAVMQTVTRNPLAEPYTIGISSAALFGVTLSLALGFSAIPGLGRQDAAGMNAFIFAMIPAAAIVGITMFKRLTPNMMILVGIGMMYMFNAVTTLIKFNASEETLHEIYIWSLGTMSKVGWDDILPLFLATLLVFFGLTIMAGKINILMSGDKVCKSLGENPILIRIICFVIVSFGVAVCVRYTGTIGFVGLVAPHLTRLFVGNNNKLLIPVSALAGSLLILVGDVIVRLLPGGLPAGVITALIGSPLFLYFLFKQRSNKNF